MARELEKLGSTSLPRKPIATDLMTPAFMATVQNASRPRVHGILREFWCENAVN
jgi:hypothetical protein